MYHVPQIIPFEKLPAAAQAARPGRLSLQAKIMSEKKLPEIHICTPEEIEGQRTACRLASELLDYITPFVKPGVATIELDRLIHDYTVDVQKCRPADLGVKNDRGVPFPASSCISVNNVVCHGIPSEKKLKNGDIVNIDVTSIWNDFYGDTSRMFIVGKPTIAGSRLCRVTYESMWRGIEAVKPGNTFLDIALACNKVAVDAGCSMVREYGGHGIGKGVFHGEPWVSHYPIPPADYPPSGIVLEPGMMFTIEPMVNAGRHRISNLGDGWTVVTTDRSLSAQWEHTLYVTETGYEVLTHSSGCPKPPEWASQQW